VEQALQALQSTALAIPAFCRIVQRKTVPGGGNYQSAHVLVRRMNTGHIENVLEIRIACCGNVDAGKSTYVSASYVLSLSTIVLNETLICYFFIADLAWWDKKVIDVMVVCLVSSPLDRSMMGVVWPA
jgi:hypothetical protein